MRVSIAYDGTTPVSETLDAVLTAEAAGLDGAWSAEHVGLNDAIVPSTLYAVRTERLEIGLLGQNLDTRHPGLLAMELATLANLAPGRLRVQVGTGSPVRAAQLGFAPMRSAELIEEFVRSLRALLAGEEVTVVTERFRMAGLRIVPPAVPPAIDIMAIRPRMTALAARIADGISLSVGASRDYLSAQVMHVERLLDECGRNRAEFRICASVLASVGPDLADARRALAEVLCRFPLSSASLLQSGVELPPAEAVQEAVGRGGVSAAAALFSDETVDALGLVATPETLPAALDRYRAIGVDEVIFMIVGPVSKHPDVVRELAAARSR